MDVSDEEYEILKSKKEELGLNWREALIRGLAVGPTPIEQLGFPDPLKDVSAAAARDEEFLKQIKNSNN